MKKFQLMYTSILIILSFLFVFKLNINEFAKIGICFFIVILPIIFKLISLVYSYFIDSRMDTILKAMIDNLPTSELKIVLFEVIKSYDHTLNGLSKTISNISEIANENFSDENTHKIGLAFKYANENMDKEKKFNSLKIYRALKTSNDDLFYRYTSGSIPETNGKRVIIKCLVSVVYWLLSSLWVIHAIFPNFAHFILIPVSLILNCILFKPVSRIINASYIHSALVWILIIVVSLRAVNSIRLIDFYQHGDYYTLVFIFILLSFIFSGIWITNKLWTCTSIEEKNKGSFISNRKLLLVIHTKFISKTRWMWLWVTFFIIIAYIIFFFSIVYKNHFSLGNWYYCFLFSISLFFGECNTDFSSIKGFYFSLEIIASFLTNTLFISNAVRLMFNPQIQKK